MIEFLGLCRRAGKLTIGVKLTIEAIKKSEVYCVVITSDASAKTKKEAEFFAGDKIPVIITSQTTDDIKRIINVPCAVLGITDENMAKKVIALEGTSM